MELTLDSKREPLFDSSNIVGNQLDTSIKYRGYSTAGNEPSLEYDTIRMSSEGHLI